MQELRGRVEAKKNDVVSVRAPLDLGLACHLLEMLHRFNMKLPNGVNAVVDIVKLRDYCLSSQHPEGRHKARVFLSALGMPSSDAEKLREILLSAASKNNEASMTDADKYGCRYSLDVLVTWGSREAIVRSAWIIKAGEDFPRLVSCYVLRGSV